MDPRDIKKSGLKITLPRKLILEILESSEQHHLSAEDVYKILLERDENVGIATVYRVLAQFETAGLVERHQFEGVTSVFELKPDTHHDHLICITCGAVIEFVNPRIEQEQHNIAEQAGFKLSGHSLNIYGECLKPDTCQRRQESDKKHDA